MEYPSNPVKPDLFDVLATAVYFAAVELAAVYPQNQDDPEIDSVATWQKYLIQQAIKKQDQMTEEERFAFRQTHFPSR
jgi:hypothetical protein